MPEPRPDDPITPARAIAFLRGNTTGVLRFDERVQPVHYVFDAEGHLVLPASPIMLEAENPVLFIPDEGTDAMEVLVTLQPIDDETAEADRWRIYHGERDMAHLARAWIETAKMYGRVFDGDGITGPNPMAPIEARTCSHVNRERRDDLRRLVAARLDLDLSDPRLVGIDPDGLDVRARFGIVRLPLEDLPADPEEAAARVEALLDDPEGAEEPS